MWVMRAACAAKTYAIMLLLQALLAVTGSPIVMGILVGIGVLAKICVAYCAHMVDRRLSEQMKKVAGPWLRVLRDSKVMLGLAGCCFVASMIVAANGHACLAASLILCDCLVWKGEGG